MRPLSIQFRIDKDGRDGLLAVRCFEWVNSHDFLKQGSDGIQLTLSLLPLLLAHSTKHSEWQIRVCIALAGFPADSAFYIPFLFAFLTNMDLLRKTIRGITVLIIYGFLILLGVHCIRLGPALIFRVLNGPVEVGIAGQLLLLIVTLASVIIENQLMLFIIVFSIDILICLELCLLAELL